MHIEAHAKINTVLDVTGRRPDGYHEVDMVLQELALHDDVELAFGPDGAEESGSRTGKTDALRTAAGEACSWPGGAVPAMPRILVTVSDDAGNPIPGVPSDDRNIAVKAARRFFEELSSALEGDADADFCAVSGTVKQAFSTSVKTASGCCPELPSAAALGLAAGRTAIPQQLYIRLTKRIPAAAGLAGGSTDAAAVLKGLNELCRAGFSTEKLCEIGLKVGADVPYCICGGTMRAQGIGEKLTRLPAMPKVPVLLVKTAEGVSTKEIYEALDPILERNDNACSTLKTKCAASRSVSGTIHPDVERCIDIFPRTDTAAGLSELAEACGNILELVTAEKLPVIKEIEKQMQKEGALCTMMSGSGPTVFGLFAEETARDRAAEILAGHFGSSVEIRRTETV